MNLFVKKPVEALLREAKNEDGKGLRRVLGPWGLIALGIGVIIGAGLFSVTGVVAGTHAGPAITLSFVFAAIACAFAGLCYAEFASMIPISGSAYSYSYLTMGELVAWIIGWDLVLEYAVAALTVSISWSKYFCILMDSVGWHLPAEWTACPAEGGIVNIPAGVRGVHRGAAVAATGSRYAGQRALQRPHRRTEDCSGSGVHHPGSELHPASQPQALHP